MQGFFYNYPFLETSAITLKHIKTILEILTPNYIAQFDH